MKIIGKNEFGPGAVSSGPFRTIPGFLTTRPRCGDLKSMETSATPTIVPEAAAKYDGAEAMKAIFTEYGKELDSMVCLSTILYECIFVF